MDSPNPNIQSPGLKYQQVIGQCRNLALVKLSALLGEMYKHAEPALLEFANKAERSTIRDLFIEASRNIKRKQSLVEQTFQKEISKGYTHFLDKHSSIPEESKLEVPQHSQWSLVDTTDLEDDIALQKIAYKINNLYYREIHAYTQRMTLIHGGTRLADQDLPASPIHIMNAFNTAISKTEIDNRTKLIMFALFEKYVMKSIGSIYNGCNKHLIEANIFPNLKPIASPSSTPEQQTPHDDLKSDASISEDETHNAIAKSEALNSELLNTVSSLLISRRQNDPAYASAPATSAAPNEMAGKPTLLQQLTNIQPSTSTAITTANTSAQSTAGLQQQHAPDQTLQVDHAFIEELRNTLTGERDKLFNGIDRRRIPTADMNTIELVGMLFEQILNDPVLPNTAKALLCHLHTPYLKAAIIDTKTLTSEDHPSQRLLNLMIRVSSQWIDEMNLDIGIYSHLREIIDSILGNFEENLQIFEDSYEELRNHTTRLEQKSAAIEKRSQEAARGRDKFESAGTLAMQTIHDRTKAYKQISDIALHFFKHAWTDKLILIILRDPNFRDSEIWHESLQIMDEILKSLNVDTAKKESIQFRKQLDILRKNIEQSLSTLGNYHQVDVDTLFKLLTGTLTAAEEQQARAAIATTPRSTKESLGIDPQILTFTDEELKMLRTLEKVKCGTWFEYLINGRKGKRRVKLSWYSPTTKKYMFVDHNGIQAMVISTHTLVRDLCEENTRILGRTQIPFISQAYGAIKDKLQQTIKPDDS